MDDRPVLKTLVLKTFSPEETEGFGRRLAQFLGPGDVLGLRGELGSGKTCLVRGICAGLGVRDRVTSPTFLTVNEYRGRLPVYHMDLFRLGRVEDSRAQGYDELIFGTGVTLIEWSEKIAHSLPADRVEVELQIAGLRERRLICTATGLRGRRILSSARCEA